ncbi:hypothetical protein [Kitasatospora sp. NPDC057223]|uniref:hypothetical protein n=1 Tax=Kitasatospora sp. NPDC057223 TaxID=3346055 RepID=UPI00363A56DD
MNDNSTPDPQLTSALALVELRQMPELQAVKWSLSPALGLMGDYREAPADAMQTVVALLGGSPFDPWLNGDGTRVSQLLAVEWHGVHLSISVSVSAKAHPKPADVAEQLWACAYIGKHGDPNCWCEDDSASYAHALAAWRAVAA